MPLENTSARPLDMTTDGSPIGQAQPLILVTNDDGVYSPGILALKDGLEQVGRVVVMAPDRNRTAAGHNKTMHKPLRVQRVTLSDGSRAFACSGSPSDAVALALLGLLPRKPDLVVSGINHGANLGHDVTYSGTVAAAMEGVIFDVPSIAVSVDTWQRSDKAALVAAGGFAAILVFAERQLNGGVSAFAASAATVPGTKFIEGAPMNAATKVLAGRS